MSPDSETGIVNTRTFEVSRDLLFEACSNPDHLVHWWGPQGFANTFHEFDFRPGGAWRFVMQGPDGTEYAMDKEFVEIVKPERIVLLHRQEGHNFRMTLTFEDAPGGTRLTWRMLFEDLEENTRLRDVIFEANEQNFDRLQAYLELQAYG